MNNDKPAVNTTQPAAVGEIPAVVQTDDAEAKIAALEDTKASLTTEVANWKLAALKAKAKIKEGIDPEEANRESIAAIVQEELAKSNLARVSQEQAEVLKKVLKENKELKLANANKANVTPPAAVGTHSEGKAVADTWITPEQIAAFKAKGWTDKDIERYKKNYQKAGGR